MMKMSERITIYLRYNVMHMYLFQVDMLGSAGITPKYSWAILCRKVGQFCAGKLGNSVQESWAILCRKVGQFCAGKLGNSVQESWAILCRKVGQFCAGKLGNSVQERVLSSPRVKHYMMLRNSE